MFCTDVPEYGCVVAKVVDVAAAEVASCFPVSRSMCWSSPQCVVAVHWGSVALARAGGGGVCGVAGHHSGQGGGIWSAEEVDIRHPLLW